MKRVLWGIVGLVAGGALFFATAFFSRDYLPDAVMAHLDDSANLRIALRVLAGALIGGPLLYLVYAILQLGSETVSTDIDGYRVSRLKVGARWGLALASLGLIAVMYFAANEIGPPVGYVVFGPVAAFFAYAGFWIATVKLRYDDNNLIVTNYWFGRDHYRWVDLEKVEPNNDSMEYFLHFKGAVKPAKISYFFTGIHDLIAGASSFAHARTARG